MSVFDLTSADGTRIRGWTNDGSGPAVLLCNGLGAPAQSWPLLTGSDSGFRVASWDYRGLGGSARPADPKRIGVADHLADALTVADTAGLDEFVVLAWSIGVNVAFELASVCPGRVRAVLGVAGVPGGSFQAMFGPLRGAARARHAGAVGAAKALRLAGPALNRVARSTPLNRATATLIRHSGVVHRAARPEYLLPTVAEFREHDFRWYFTLAVAMAEHHPMDLAFVRCPVTLAGGRRDILVSRHDLERAAARIPHAKLVMLDGSHFLPLERPAELTALLRELVG
ncbi:MAG TPA: alpha/beta hydrolase [Frankiaceae bacterium]|nr:alpha/beta hydrolase [Frankiaceae bacterium]